ncbi:hypothetical protein BJF89_16040 [Corynebacterium sp. CNJ-954]|uniref:hypothetical protein n=1 Tax=Corynebacterium sp. CNJ-954 TaxID=1904962 RepID=UPI00095E7E4E|nr:hypothetical protein [Corynebacterium sp. CNJ-954]OLT55264.1 hypothetical protein BJF89_16040 [Corynebacterium sp. CNJ-954]
MTTQRTSSDPQHEPQEWLTRLDKIAQATSAWRSRTQNPSPIETGSSLAADELESVSVGNTAWYSMCVSTEHLGFSLDAMKATATMYPTAYMTVARTAFMAAANAAWLLAEPSRSQRRERAIRLQADELRVQITTLKSLSLPDGEPDTARVEAVQRLRQRQEILRNTAGQLGITEKVEQMRFNQTEAIDWVARRMPDSDDPFLLAAMQTIWRSGSAAADAQRQFALMRMGPHELGEGVDGTRIMKLRGDLDTDVGPALGGAALTLSEAFRLYDLSRLRKI